MSYVYLIRLYNPDDDVWIDYPDFTLDALKTQKRGGGGFVDFVKKPHFFQKKEELQKTEEEEKAAIEAAEKAAIEAIESAEKAAIEAAAKKKAKDAADEESKIKWNSRKEAVKKFTNESGKKISTFANDSKLKILKQTEIIIETPNGKITLTCDANANILNASPFELMQNTNAKVEAKGAVEDFVNKINREGYIPICFIMKFSKTPETNLDEDVTIIKDGDLTCEIYFKKSILDLQNEQTTDFKKGLSDFKLAKNSISSADLYSSGFVTGKDVPISTKTSPLCNLMNSQMKGGARHTMVRLYNPIPERKTDYYNYE